MEFSDYFSMIALAVSMVSAGFSVWFGLQDRSRIKTNSQLLQAYPTEDEEPLGPPTVSSPTTMIPGRPTFTSKIP